MNDTDPKQPDPTLLRLLRLKRYEVPPPGFFDDLQGKIRSQLASEPAQTGRKKSWWGQWLFSLEWNPAATGALSLCLAAMVLGGWTVFQRAQKRETADNAVIPEGVRMVGQNGSPVSTNTALIQTATNSSSALAGSSTNETSAFDIPDLKVERVDFK